ncbi:unnamed protein product, partial [Ectocarpus sp. 8 AP-2014]
MLDTQGTEPANKASTASRVPGPEILSRRHDHMRCPPPLEVWGVTTHRFASNSSKIPNSDFLSKIERTCSKIFGASSFKILKNSKFFRRPQNRRSTVYGFGSLKILEAKSRCIKRPYSSRRNFCIYCTCSRCTMSIASVNMYFFRPS